ncbi:MAG: hydroxymethylglutaryl-CoA reductase, degradative [Myxococcales bacterium]|nr:hydroxymethylglutaryl-CoA reductase, degradative [Myxococcales bacterium]
MTMTSSSRIPKFFKRSVRERVALLRERGVIDDEVYQTLLDGAQVLSPSGADRLVENVVGVFGLPLALALNFRINDRPYIVPMVVEEPSIVAGVSSAAKLVGSGEGFVVESGDSLLIGQIQIVDVDDSTRARARLLDAREEILELANSLHTRMVARGGGARDMKVVVHPTETYGDMVVVHLLVDTRDAMGANLVNTMCEGVASLIERVAGGRVLLRILSNLTDRALVRAKATIPLELLAGKGYDGAEVRDGIIQASELARIDPYRAATHNKGIMNGVDAVAIAVGNDWRAIEAAAHAYAGLGRSYTSLTRWYSDPHGNLVGTIELPLKVGTVGGSIQANPAVEICLRILNVDSARELAEVMAAVGLAQNFAALRALVTDGIQSGHMKLHARSVATAAGAPDHIFESVVQKLVESKEIKVWHAERIIAKLNGAEPDDDNAEQVKIAGEGWGHGKAIITGEHAVVYGAHAIAAPISLAVKATVEIRKSGPVRLVIPKWSVEEELNGGVAPVRDSLQESLDVMLRHLDLRDQPMQITLHPNIPRAMGLGSSASMAVALIRALSESFKLGLDDDEINKLAYESETVAHGTPSGLDNTVATHGKLLVYKRGENGQPPTFRALEPAQPIPVVVGITGKQSLTAATVGRVRESWQREPALYESIFKQIDGLSLEAAKAIEAGNFERLGDLMNVNHGLLNALQVSCKQVEELVELARSAGALGAKLTGGGGGGSIVALCPGRQDVVADAIRYAGYEAVVANLGERHEHPRADDA